MSVAQPKLSRDEIAATVHSLGEWFHNIDLGGVMTAPNHFLGNYPAVKWQRFSHAIPEELTGRSVLDIGCNAGFYSIEMKKRGASRVVGVDTDERYLEQARFAAQVTGQEIEFERMSVYDVGSLGEKFDLVIFMGVLYHLRHPLLALDLLHEHVVGDLLVFQSMLRGSSDEPALEENYPIEDTEPFDDPDFPKMFFIERRYADDPTNWWIPNASCARAMLRSSGFSILGQPEEEVFLCRRMETIGEAGAVYPQKGPS
jgi:tRNA (mo5U34)-methyltransferase